MKNILFLGCENSHAKQFLNYLKDKLTFKDINVLGCHSIYEKDKEDLAKEFNIKSLNSFDGVDVNEVDGVVVTARHGGYHLEFLRPYIKKGITWFVDKPITIKEEDAIELINIAKNNDIKLTGGSSLPFNPAVIKMKKLCKDGKLFGGFVRAPINMVNPYGGFYFYCEHLVDMVLSVFGYYPNSVSSVDFEKHISVIFKYDNYCVQGIFGKDNYVYSIGVHCYDRNYSEEIVINGSEKCFEDHFKDFYNALNSAENKTDYNKFIAPVFVMNSIERSLKSGKEEVVHKYKLQ